MGWSSGSFHVQMSTLTGSGASSGSALGAAAVPKKSLAPSLENSSFPFSLGAHPGFMPPAEGEAASAAASAPAAQTYTL
jgi:hypothetical protein